MIYDGAVATNGIFEAGIWVWSIVIGVLIIVWIAVGITNLGLLNKITMALLLCAHYGALLRHIPRRQTPTATATETMTFGAAVELAVSMPLSWLPVISDYTREARSRSKRRWPAP